VLGGLPLTDKAIRRQKVTTADPVESVAKSHWMSFAKRRQSTETLKQEEIVRITGRKKNAAQLVSLRRERKDGLAQRGGEVESTDVPSTHQARGSSGKDFSLLPHCASKKEKAQGRHVQSW